MREWPGRIVGCLDYAVRAAGTPYRGVPREPWDEGFPYWWDLSGVVCFDEPISCRGSVGMWQMPDDLAQTVTSVDKTLRNGK